MVTVEISTGLLVVLLLSGIIFLMMEYWFARCDVRRYQQWYEDMCHNWSREMHENRKIKQQLYQREKEDDGWHSNNRRNAYSPIHGVGTVYPDGHIKYLDGTIKHEKEED